MVRTYDEASAARRRRLAAIRTFITFHGLPIGLANKMLSYAEGDWQMTAGINIDRAVGQLPAAIRSQVLMRIHADLRQECLLFHGLPRECICLLFGALQPQLCLQGEPLIEPGQLLWELFMLRRGSLSIKRATADTIVRQATMAINNKWTKKQKGKDERGAQLTCAKKKRRGAESEALYARVLDKPGQYIGLVHPFRKPPRALFRVSAIKQCQLLRVTQSSLWKILSHFGPEVQERFCELLRDHYDATLAALRLPAYNPESEQQVHGDGAFRKSFTGSYAVEELIANRAGNSNHDNGGGAEAKGVSALQKQADIKEVQSGIGQLQSQLETCEARSAALQVTAASLPVLCELLLRTTETMKQRGNLPSLPSGLMDEAKSESQSGNATEGVGTALKPRPLMRQATLAKQRWQNASKMITLGKDTSTHYGGQQRQSTRSLWGGKNPPKQALQPAEV